VKLQKFPIYPSGLKLLHSSVIGNLGGLIMTAHTSLYLCCPNERMKSSLTHFMRILNSRVV